MDKRKLIRNCVAGSNVCGAIIKMASKAIIVFGAIGLTCTLIADNVERSEKLKKIQKVLNKTK